MVSVNRVIRYNGPEEQTLIREMFWSAHCLFLIACFIPLLPLFVGNMETTFPPQAADANFRYWYWSIPLLAVLIAALIGRYQLSKDRLATLVHTLFLSVLSILVLFLAFETGEGLLVVIPVVLISLSYGCKFGLVGGAFLIVLMGAHRCLVGGGPSSTFVVLALVLMTLAYLVGGIVDLNSKLLRRLNDEKAVLKNLIDSIPLSVMLVSNGEIVYRNARFGEPETKLLSHLQEHGGGTNLSSTEIEYEGRQYRIGARECPSGPDGEKGRLWIIEDLSEAHRLEDEIRRASYLASVGEMAAGVAHELRNPLTVISGFVQLLLEKPDTSSLRDARPYLEISHNELKRLSRIISDFLALSKPQETVKTPVNLNALLTQIGEFLENEALRRDVALQMSLDPSVYEVMGDPASLKQVILNLVGNAFDAVDPGGKVSIKTNTTPDTVSFVVEDNGVGISEALSDKVFAPFFSTKDGGTGIGLAISRRIIFDHNGTLTFRSSPGATQFIVTLPVARKALIGSAHTGHAL